MKQLTYIISLVCLLSWNGVQAQSLKSPISFGFSWINPSSVSHSDSSQVKVLAGNSEGKLVNSPKSLGFQFRFPLLNQPLTIGFNGLIHSIGLQQNMLFSIPLIYKLQLNKSVVVNTHVSLGVNQENVQLNKAVLTDDNDPALISYASAVNQLYYDFGATGLYKHFMLGISHQAKHLGRQQAQTHILAAYDYVLNQRISLTAKTSVTLNKQQHLLQFSPGIMYNKLFSVGLYFSSGIPFGVFLGYQIKSNWLIQYQHNRPNNAWLGSNNIISVAYRMF
jgi:hypothetical protein